LSCFLDRRSSVLKHWNFSEPGSSHAAYAIKIYWMKSETNGYTGHTIQHNPKHLFTLYIYILLLDNNNIYIYIIYIYLIYDIYILFFGPEVLVAPGDLCRLPSKPGRGALVELDGIPVMGWHPEFSPRLRSYKSYGCREETAQTMIS
jgi:hypothetical protein